MTNTEQQRENEQARVADIVAQTMQLKLHGAAALSVIGSIVGAIIVFISISQAKEVVKPVSDMAIQNKTTIEHMSHSIESIKGDSKEMIRLLRDMNKK